MYDFLVIGGGMAGASAAARLSALGRVCLIERESALGYHSTGRSAALFEQSYGLPSTTALNRASRDTHFAREVLTQRGLLLVGRDDDRAAFDADTASMSLDRLSLTEAAELWPILDQTRIDRAAYHAECWDIDVDRLLQSFVRDLRNAGGQVVTGAEVTQLRREAQGWTVGAGAHSYQASVVVNAAGAWADKVAGLAGLDPIGLTPLRRSMARVPAPEGQDVTTWPMLFGPGESFYAKPDAGALLVSPADEDPSPAMDAWPEDLVLAEGIATFETYVTHRVTRMLSSWAGLRTFAPDRQLVLGPAPQDAQFVWCAGQGGYGIQTAPAASRLIADLIAGRGPELDAATVTKLSPARFAA